MTSKNKLAGKVLTTLAKVDFFLKMFLRKHLKDFYHFKPDKIHSLTYTYMLTVKNHSQFNILEMFIDFIEA